MKFKINKRAILEESILDKVSNFYHKRLLGQTPDNGYTKDSHGNYHYDKSHDENNKAQYHRPTHVNDGDGNVKENSLEDVQ